MAKEKTPPCNKGCGQRVWFDWSAKAGDPGRSDYGKMRALQVSSDGEMLNEIHECPNSTYNKKSNGGGSGGGTGNTVVMERLEALLGNSMDAIARIEKLDKRFDELTKILMHLSVGQKNLNNSTTEQFREENTETKQ